MRFVAEPISDLRLTRFHRWAMLWLQWFVSFLDAASAFAPISKPVEAIGHRRLDCIERAIFSIVMLRAAPLVRWLPQAKGVCRRRRKQTSLMRTVIGCAMRRSLRSRDLRARIVLLRRADIGALVARLLKRLPRGLTRRSPVLPAPEPRFIDARGVRLTPTHAADTS